jgi:hypothetical protein
MNGPHRNSVPVKSLGPGSRFTGSPAFTLIELVLVIARNGPCFQALLKKLRLEE